MPVQCLIRKLTRAQVDKAIADSKAQITVKDHDGEILILVTATENGEGKDPAGNLALQKIADMDAELAQKEVDEAAATKKAAKAAAVAAKP